MKNLYIKPVTSVVALTYDVVLLGQSEGRETTVFDAKKHDFADDSFDNTAWPKSKSPWED